MSNKSSLEYTEQMGLEIAYSDLKTLKQPTNEQCIVLDWLKKRIKELREK